MKTTISVGKPLVLCCIVFLCASMPPPSIQGQNQHRQGHPAKEVYTGSAVAVGGQFGGASRPFTLEVTGYTPDEEVQQDFQIL